MLEFKQLAGGTPPDIEIKTDDADAEMAHLQDDVIAEGDFEDTAFANNVAGAERGEDGYFTFVLPGDEAGEVSDFWPALEEQIEAWNAEAVARAEEQTARAVGE